MSELSKPNRKRRLVYWISTVLASTELIVGGFWDIFKIPLVTELIDRLGYPHYFLIILGTWKILGAIALMAPRWPLLKEWAYAGTLFNYTGAIASLLIAGRGFAEVIYPLVQTALVVISWASRPPSRRCKRQEFIGA